MLGKNLAAIGVDKTIVLLLKVGVLVEFLYNTSIMIYYYMSVVDSYFINLLSSSSSLDSLFTDKLDSQCDLEFELSSDSCR